MGVEGLPKDLKTGLTATSMADCGLEGLSVGVDTSVLIYKALLSCQYVLSQYWTLPLIPVSALTEYFRLFIDAMTAAGVSKLIFCFDGASNPAKEGTNTARTAKRNRILDEIQAFYTSGNHADWPQVKKLMQSAMYPRSDIILELVSWLKEKGYEVVGAPFEADWQLIQLEKEGRTDASLTVDSDLFVVGSKLLILDFALNRSNPGTY